MAAMLTKRPRLRLPLSPAEKIVEVAAGAGLVFMAFTLFRYWSGLPESVPHHFNAAGEADGWGGKGFLFSLPAVGLVLYAGMTVLNRFPHIFNYPFALTEENVERQYRYARLMLSTMKAAIVWIFAYINWTSIQTALGNAAGLGKAFLPAILIGTTLPIAIYFWLARRAR